VGHRLHTSRSIGVLALILGLLGASPHAVGAAAGQANPEPRSSGPREERLVYVEAGLRAAVKYWAPREDGVHRCAAAADIEIVAPSRVHGNAGGARLGGCEIGRPDMKLSRTLFDDRWGSQRWPLICQVVSHEFGHLLGRGHTRRGLMAPSNDILERFVRSYCGRDPITSRSG
jgi:hypothetical protein